MTLRTRLRPVEPVEEILVVGARRRPVRSAVRDGVGRKAGPACVQMCPHGAAVRVSFKQQDLIDSLFR